jgi:hypothetical protein
MEQAYTYAEPDSTKGFVNYVDLEPNTVGGFGDKPFFYEQYKRYLWVQPSSGITSAWKQGLGFINVATLIPANTITELMLQEGIIEGRHFKPKQGKGFAWLVNSAENGWVLADPVLNHGNGTIPVSLLTGSTTIAPNPGATLQFLKSNAGAVSWATLDGHHINDALRKVGPLLDILAIDGTQGGPGAIPQIADNFFVVWTQPGDLLKDGAVPITKLTTGGVVNKLKLIRVKEDGSVFEYFTPDAAAAPIIKYKEDTSVQPVPAAESFAIWAHGLGALPTSASFKFVCTTANNNYLTGDTIDPSIVTVGAGGGNEGYAAFTLQWDATNVRTIHGKFDVSSRNFTSRVSPYPSVSFDPSQWKVVMSATINTITTP